MHPTKLACALTALVALLPAAAAADDRALCEELSPRRDAALAACDRILAAGGLDDRERASVLVGRGLHYWVKEREKALADLDAAIALQPDLARAWWGRAYFNQMAHDMRKDRAMRERVITDYSKAIELDRGYIAAYYARGNMRSAYDRDYDAAIADYSRIIELQPNNREARHARANDYGRKGDFERQLADLSELVRLAPNRDAYINRGMFHLARQDYDNAIADLSEARKRDPFHPSALSGLATAYTARGDYQDALKLHDYAIKQAPHLTWVYTSRARTYLKMGEHEKALADVQRALSVFSKNTHSLSLRASINEAMGRREDAVADFRAVLALDPSPQERDASRAALQRLGVEP